jgi:thioredoxin reductase (NADPH)
VLLATGGLDVEPQIPDAKALVKAGLIRHCPICDAYEARGQKIALLSYGECRIKEALLIRGYTADLTVLTLGHEAVIAPGDLTLLQDAGIEVVMAPIARLSREAGKIAAWPADGGSPLYFDTIYSALGMKLRSELAIALGADTDADGALLVDRHQQTTVHGLYAAGDIVHGLSQVSVAAGQAAIAATAINASLPPLRY